MLQIAAFDHIGIRVTDLDRALAFYALLGFRLEPEETWEEHRAVGLINDAGLRLNLIYNAKPRRATPNVLLDEPEKWAGFTHLALSVDDLDRVMRLLGEHGISLTEGPMALGEQRRICFIRDPDGNVIEFTERWSEVAGEHARI
jgi:lactoylglutathione lyase